MRYIRVVISRTSSHRNVRLALFAAGLFFTTRAIAADEARPRSADLDSPDARLRARAVDALGGAGGEAAIASACSALSDRAESVRTAAFGALVKAAGPAALKCLRGAAPRAQSPGVRAQIQKAIVALVGGSRVARPITADTKVYVAIQIVSKSSRPKAEIEAVTRSSLMQALESQEGFAVAPADESTARGAQVVKSHALRGVLLTVTVEPAAYAAGNLSQATRVTVWTYPGRALQAQYEKELTRTNTARDDVASDDELLRASMSLVAKTLVAASEPSR